MDEMIRCYPKGEVIFTEGSFEKAMYDLVEGEVGIYAHYGRPDVRLLTVLKAEDKATFGEMGLLDSMPRSATAVALEDVKVGYITGETFGSHFGENPEAVLRIMQNMSKRIRELTQNYLDACRAVAESVDSERTGKEKSGWFRNKVSQFIRDYEAGLQAAREYGYDLSYQPLIGEYW